VREPVFRHHGRAEVMECVVVVAFLEVVADEVDVQGFAGPDPQAGAIGLGVAIVDVGPREEVRAVALALVEATGQSSHQHAAGRERAADRALDRRGRVVAERVVEVAVEFLGRLLRDHVDHARGGAASIERALRAAQDFDLLEVVEARELRRRSRDHRAVLQERHGAVRTEVDAGHADAADERAIDAELVADRKVRHRHGQVTDLLDAPRAHRVGRDGRDRRRRVLERDRLLRRGDDDFLERQRARLLRKGERCGTRQGEQDGGAQRGRTTEGSVHLSPPSWNLRPVPAPVRVRIATSERHLRPKCDLCIATFTVSQVSCMTVTFLHHPARCSCTAVSDGST
jgi:hypothetical protein